MTTQTEIDQLAALLDGAIGAGEVSPQLAALASLATRVTTTFPVATPSLAFREALRGDLLQSVAGNATATAASTATSTAATTATTSAASQVAAWVAGLTATALLATTGVVAFAPSAVPGDALYGAKRAIEQGQLRVADPTERAALLLDLATMRVQEALGLTDALAVERLLDDSQRQLRDALVLLDTLPADVAASLMAAQVADHTAALEALRSTSTAEVATRVDRLLDQTRALTSTVVTPPTDGAPPATPVTPPQPTTTPDTPAPGATTPAAEPTSPTGTPSVPSDGSTQVPSDPGTDPVDDIVDDLPDPLEGGIGGPTGGVGDLLRP